MSFVIGNNINFQDSSGNVKNLATEMAKIGSGGGNSALVGTVAYNSNPVKQASAMTFDSTTSTITITGHGLSANTPIAFVPDIGAEIAQGPGDLPTGLIYNRTYYVLVVDQDHIQISTTSGGSAQAFTTNGRGLRFHMETLSSKQVTITNLNVDSIRLIVHPALSSYYMASAEIFRVSLTDVGDGGNTFATGAGGGSTYGVNMGIAEITARAYNNYIMSTCVGGYGGYNSSNQFTVIKDNNPTVKSIAFTSPAFKTITVGVGYNNNPFLLNGFKVEIWSL